MELEVICGDDMRMVLEEFKLLASLRSHSSHYSSR